MSGQVGEGSIPDPVSGFVVTLASGCRLSKCSSGFLWVVFSPRDRRARVSESGSVPSPGGRLG